LTGILTAGGLIFQFDMADKKAIKEDAAQASIPNAGTKDQPGSKKTMQQESTIVPQKDNSITELALIKPGSSYYKSKTVNTKNSPVVTKKVEIPPAGNNSIPPADGMNSNAATIVSKSQEIPTDTNAIVKQQNKPGQKAPVIDTAITSVAPSEKRERKTSKWSLGITMDIGNTIATESRLFGFGQKEVLYTTVGSTSGPLTSVGSSFRNRTTSAGKISFSIGIMADRKLSKRISLQSSLGWSRQSFSVTRSQWKDSLSPGMVNSYLVSMHSRSYRFDFINAYAGVTLNMVQVNDLILGVAAGIDNQFLFSAKQEKRDVSASTNPNSYDKNLSMDNYHKWQPQLRFQLVTAFNSGSKNWLQLSPYFTYGLKTFENQPATSRDRLVSFGIKSTYFFR